MTPLPRTDAEVNAYVDGELAPARTADVEQELARDPAIAARVADMRQQNALLREVLDPWLADPIPAALVDAARAPQPRNRGKELRMRKRWFRGHG